MGIYRLKRKSFTKYDDTDNLKRMKDSDILAEKKKTPATTPYHTVAATLGGGLVGGALGAAGNAAFGRKVAKGGAKFGKRFVKGGKVGILAGAAIGLSTMSARRNKEQADNEFYNRRLEYAQRQAKRREKADWKSNMTQRDGYSY